MGVQSVPSLHLLLERQLCQAGPTMLVGGSARQRGRRLALALALPVVLITQFVFSFAAASSSGENAAVRLQCHSRAAARRARGLLR